MVIVPGLFALIFMNIYENPIDSWRLSVAPMLDVTDRHSRFFHRLLAPNALLYTEMVTTGALLFGDVERHLKYNEQEHPVALQLGGSDPQDLARCAKLGEEWGYDEINLNCGCPSDRVQKGAFGACLMESPELVADCYTAMQDSVDVPVTIKHRLGLDYSDDYGFVHRFVGTIYERGCRVFIVHARNAVLKGLSPKENRQIPPLKYDWVTRLKSDFPEAIFVLNGGLYDIDLMTGELAKHDGIMLGRAAWQEPYMLSIMHQKIWPELSLTPIDEVIEKVYQYALEQTAQGVPLRFVYKPLLGLFNGKKGAKVWRRMLSDPQALKNNQCEILMQAYENFS